MKLVYVGEENIDPYLTDEMSVFAAGCTPREHLRNRDGSAIQSWRPQFIKALEKVGFDGQVFIPEKRDGGGICDNYYETQVEWEYEHLHQAHVIAFWIS